MSLPYNTVESKVDPRPICRFWTAALVISLLTVFGGIHPVSAQTVFPQAVVGAANPTLIVNSTGDGVDATGTDGVCRTATNVCTLRAAISQANYNRGADRIEFAIPGSGVKRITIASDLPSLNDPTGGVTIDGYSQAGASPNTATHGSNAIIGIEIRGGGSDTMFLIESAENTLRGLSIFGSETKIELRGEAADGNQIVGNFIGFDVAARSRGGLTGIVFNLGPDRNRIGTPDLADRNVISGSTQRQIMLNHGETSENLIQNNVIGLSPDGTRGLGSNIGVDIQWWSWGNQVGGTGPNEHNVISGHDNGVDLSHKSTGNLVLGNYIGTTIDGRSANRTTRNGRGIILKDDPVGNYFGQNIVAGAKEDYAIWHKHNYTGGNDFVDNRIGVSVDGSDIGSNDRGMLLRGHDDVYYGNIFGNIAGIETILISNTSIRDDFTFEPDEQTVGNTIRRGTYYGNRDVPIEFGSTCCPHPDEDTPQIDGIGPGQINGDSTCAGCEVEVYVSGSVNDDGSLSPGTGTTGLTWIGTVYADETGAYSMGSPLLTAGLRVAVVSNSAAGSASDFSPVRTIPARGSGLLPNPDQPVTIAAPVPPPSPPIYQPVTFDCSFDAGVLSWTDAGADPYYVFATTGGAEIYLGEFSTTSISPAAADSYRVEHWVSGIATSTTCNGAGGPEQPETFTCSYSDGMISWDNVGADAYYVFSTIDGTEFYLGGFSAISANAPAADSFRVEHWLTGQVTNATCDGGGADPFGCTVVNGVLSWDDVGAAEYYVFAGPTPSGGEGYLGAQTGNSMPVSAAGFFRVEHWLFGQATNASCSP